MNLSCFDDPAVAVAEDKTDKEALERQEYSFNQVEDLRNQNRCSNLRQIKKSDEKDLHKMEVLNEDQGRLHHRCEQLAETKDQHQRDEILMEKMKS